MGLMANVDAIVAGAGIWGCTVARRLAESGRKVLVLEKRTAVDGYNALFERMLDHPNIVVECNVGFKVQGSRFKVQGSRSKVRGFGIAAGPGLLFRADRCAVRL